MNILQSINFDYIYVSFGSILRNGIAVIKEYKNF